MSTEDPQASNSEISRLLERLDDLEERVREWGNPRKDLEENLARAIIAEGKLNSNPNFPRLIDIFEDFTAASKMETELKAQISCPSKLMETLDAIEIECKEVAPMEYVAPSERRQRKRLPRNSPTV